jgi:hypothetical protein
MHDKDKLEAILNDPASTAEEKAAAQAALGQEADPVERLHAELLQAVAKLDLSGVSFFDVQRFCKDRSFGASPQIAAATRRLYDKWLDAFLTSESGRQYLQEIASHLRTHDFHEWEFAADEWKRSNWTHSARLISVLERIADSPNRGNYHSEETVEECRLLAVEIRRRAGVQS